MCSARRHVRFAPKSGRNSGHRISVKGRALLCPVRSNVDLLRYGEGIVHITADEISHSALYLSVTKQKLDGAQIPGVALRGMRPVRRCRLLRSQSGQSGHAVLRCTCLLLTQSGQPASGLLTGGVNLNLPD